MDPQEFEKLKTDIARIVAWMEARESQLIPRLLDEGSRNNLGAPVYRGVGAHALTQSVSVPSTPTNITVPAAYSDTLILEIEGVQYEIPYLGTV